MKFRLLAEHVAPNGAVLSEGTEVGDDTPWPWRNPRGEPIEPSTQMEGLDDEGKEAVKTVHQRLYGRDPYWHDNVSEGVRKVREEEAETQAKLDEESEPVSEQQAREWKMEEERDKPLRDRAVMPGPAAQPSPTVRAAPTRGGQTRPAPGPATPSVQAENVRPEKPNEEQYPKG